MSALEIRDLRAGFGHNTVLHGVDLTVNEGEFAALLGLNGAGKSVTIKCISGLVPVWSGTVSLFGRDITGLDPEDRVHAGIAHVPQGRSVFANLTVEENLRLGGATVRDRARYAAALERVFTAFPRLAERRTQSAGTMSGGEQAMLAVGRAMMSSPRLVLVDEPSAGLSPIALGELLETIKAINADGTTVLMVEQNTTFAMKVADTVHVMQKGTIAFSSAVDALTDANDLLEHLGVGTLMRDRIASVVAARAGVEATGEPAPRRARKPAAKKKAAKARGAKAAGKAGATKRAPAKRTPKAKAKPKPRPKPKPKD